MRRYAILYQNRLGKQSTTESLNCLKTDELYQNRLGKQSTTT